MAKARKRNGGVPVLEPEAASPQSSGDTAAAHVDRDRIAERAYELYVRRGGGDGRDLDDWLEAERELGRGPEAARAASPEGPAD